MACATAMPELAKYHPDMAMNFLSHISPGFDLGRSVETRLECPGPRPRAYGDAARNNQTSSRTLREIERRVGLRRPVAVSRTRSLHRRHDNAVLEVEGAEIIRIEKGWHGKGPLEN